LAQEIKIEIKIDGLDIKSFSTLSINQVLFNHHEYKLTFNHDVVEQNKNLQLNKSKDLLGKKITITLNNIGGNYQINLIEGVVTRISLSNNINSAGDLIIVAQSPTILLETHENNSSFLEKKLEDVLKALTADADTSLLKTAFQPKTKDVIRYTSQYRESNFGYMQRLAAHYGEWFYYDGTRLIFGDRAKSSPINLVYPNDVSDYDLQLRMRHVNFEEISYLSKENEKVNKSSKEMSVDGLESMSKFALDKSKQVIGTKTSSLSTRKFNEKGQLDSSVKSMLANKASDLVILKLQTDCTEIKVGAEFKFSAKINTTDAPIDYGKFVVITAQHLMDGHGNYYNQIEAIPASIIVPPNPFVHKPNAEQQIAVVVDNKDPDNMGRVKVQFFWQENDETTSWIRVASPHHGTRNDGKKNRGLFFTPEIDDLVLVGFIQNDPDRPMVFSSVPHGKSLDSSPNSKNQTKAITTRSGSTIVFTDKEDAKEHTIKIATNNQNYVSIKVKNDDGSIKVYSSKAIEVNSKESIIVKSGTSIDVSSGKTINVKSEKITIEAKDSILLKAEKNIELKAKEIKLEALSKIEAKANQSVEIKGTKVEVAGTATAKVSAAKLDLEASAMANLKGAIVKIN
jgi:type VI secretion system secreted protein VgrG